MGARTGGGQGGRSTPGARTAQRLSVPTPFGPFVIIHRHGTVLASGWDQTTSEQCRFIHPVLRPVILEEDEEDRAGFGDLVTAFFNGQIPALPQVTSEAIGGPFTQQVWAVMHDIPPGQTVTYGELAAMAGNPMAFRAAATACARNPISLFVPCHRITAAGGKAGGYRYGLDIKAHLLALEANGLVNHKRPQIS